MFDGRTSLNAVFVSTSHDNGRSWSQAKPLPGVPNPDAKISLLKLAQDQCQEGPLLMAFNDHTKGLCPMCRTYLKLAVSTDQGKSWYAFLIRVGKFLKYSKGVVNI